MKYFLLTIIGLFMLGCSKSSDPEPEIPVLLLKRVTADGAVQNEYEYNANDEIAVATSYNTLSGEVFNEETYVYTNDKIIKTYLNALNGSTKKVHYYSTSNEESRADRFDAEGNLISYEILYGNGECGVEKQIVYYANGSIDYTFNLNFSDDNCSIDGEFIYGSGDFMFGVKNTKNEKYSPYSSVVPASIYKLKVAHNVVESVIRYVPDVVADNSSYTSTFEYNDLDYPISETRTYYNGAEVKYVYEYY